MKIKNILGAAAMAATLVAVPSCSLDEENPAGTTMDNFATSPERFQAMVNQCYFALERFFYGTADGTYGWGARDPWYSSLAVRPMRAGYMALSEAETDIWTACQDLASQEPHYFWFFAGSVNDTYTSDFWNCAYDGIGGCNTVLDYAKNAPLTDEQLNSSISEARMLRAVYYFNIVEMFGGVVEITNTSGDNVTKSPVRTAPIDIYRDVIIPDLEYAAEHLAVGTDATTTCPPRKAAIGFLAKAYLQMTRYAEGQEKTDCYENALRWAEELINDCQSGGSKYNTYLYPKLADVFDEDNNFENREALWKQRWVVTDGNAGASTGTANLNRNDERFLCHLSYFGARRKLGQDHLTWEGAKEGNFMPTRHLLDLYVQKDGSLDPRYHQWFSTEWKCNQPEGYTWTADDCKTYGKNASLAGQKIDSLQLAIKIIRPEDADYAQEIANRATSNYLVVDMNDVYSTSTNDVINTVNGDVNPYIYYWPSLNKHNSSHYYEEIVDQYRMGNLNATFIMRTPEVYLIAAEAALQTNQQGKADQYVNRIRERAGAQDLSGVTLRDIMDERARELCGEYNRFFDLVRVGYLNQQYLSETHPHLAQYFRQEYILKPIPSTYTALLENGSEFVNPGY